jgi:hypothetical protein
MLQTTNRFSLLLVDLTLRKRDSSMDFIKVEIDAEKGTISVQNDGEGRQRHFSELNRLQESLS